MYGPTQGGLHTASHFRCELYMGTEDQPPSFIEIACCDISGELVEDDVFWGDWAISAHLLITQSTSRCSNKLSSPQMQADSLLWNISKGEQKISSQQKVTALWSRSDRKWFPGKKI